MQRVDFGEREIDFGDGETYFRQGKPFTGIAYELWPGGSLRSEIEYQDGLRHNIARDWYPGGQIEGETTYHKGSVYGADWEWDEAGRLIQESRMAPDSPEYARLLKAREACDRYLDVCQKVQLKALLDEG